MFNCGGYQQYSWIPWPNLGMEHSTMFTSGGGRTSCVSGSRVFSQPVRCVASSNSNWGTKVLGWSPKWKSCNSTDFICILSTEIALLSGSFKAIPLTPNLGYCSYLRMVLIKPNLLCPGTQTYVAMRQCVLVLQSVGVFTIWYLSTC